MTRFLNRRQKVFRTIVGMLVYCLVVFPIINSTVFISMAHAEETVKLSKKEKKKLVEQGVAQYKKGERAQAKKTLEQAKAVFSDNYAVPYYLGLIYLEEGQRSAAIDEWQKYVKMDPKSENSMRIRKNLTLLLREEAKESAKHAVANEAALLRGPVADNTVAVSSFKNLGSENLGPLGKGMAAMLIHDLSQVPDLQVVERVKLQALLQEMNLGTSGLVDKKTAPKVGKLLKAKHVTSGSMADLEKENLLIASVVVDSEQMTSIGTQEAQGALKEFYDLEKVIAYDIIKDLGYDPDKVPGEFGKIHTKSLAALTSFSVGLDYLDQEKYDEAREEFQKALDEDPKFELAEAALLATPFTAMMLMSSSEMVSGLSASGTSSTAAGSAVVSGAGIGTTATIAVGAAVVVGGAVSLSQKEDPNDPSSVNLTGVWIGTWNDPISGTNGDLTFTLVQTGTSVSGTVTITGPTCISTGTVTGNISGSDADLVIDSGADIASYNATCTPTSMNGTLEYTAGTCDGDTGNFSALITGSAVIGW